MPTVPSRARGSAARGPSPAVHRPKGNRRIPTRSPLAPNHPLGHHDIDRPPRTHHHHDVVAEWRSSLRSQPGAQQLAQVGRRNEHVRLAHLSLFEHALPHQLEQVASRRLVADTMRDPV